MVLKIETVGLGVKATLTDNDTIRHQIIYRNIDEALWQGMRWALKIVDGVHGVVVDGESVTDVCEVEERLWRYLDGMGDREPRATSLTNAMIVLLSL